MKVLHVINSLNVGGAENLLTNYLTYVNSKDDTVNELCLLYNSDTFLKDKIVKENIKLYDIKSQRKYDLSIVLKLIKLIRQNKYDIVHVHLFPAQYFCSIASWFCRKTKFVFTEHSTTNRRRGKKLFHFMDYISYRQYNKIICVSEMAKIDLLKWMPSIKNKVKTIYNGVSLEKNKNTENYAKEYDLILVGSMWSDVKGIDILLNAIKLIEDKINKVIIAGDGTLKGEYILLRDKLGLSSKVDFLGNRNDIIELLQKSKVFVMPSRWEGLPMALLEAMSQMKPIIATNVGGIPEIIEDGFSGILVQLGDIEELSIKIQELLSNDKLANQLGKNAYRQVYENFSIQKYANDLLNLYSNICLK